MPEAAAGRDGWRKKAHPPALATLQRHGHAFLEASLKEGLPGAGRASLELVAERRRKRDELLAVTFLQRLRAGSLLELAVVCAAVEEAADSLGKPAEHLAGHFGQTLPKQVQGIRLGQELFHEAALDGDHARRLPPPGPDVQPELSEGGETPFSGYLEVTLQETGTPGNSLAGPKRQQKIAFVEGQAEIDLVPSSALDGAK